MTGRVANLSLSPQHTFAKQTAPRLRLIAGIGVEGDVHAGQTVKHRSRVKADPNQANLRQVHLLALELLTELKGEGFEVFPGRLGENILTQGFELLALPKGSRLAIGASAVLELTGLRNPCVQLDHVGEGLMQRLVERSAQGALIRKAGAMAVVLDGGEISVGDEIRIVLPPEPRRPMERV